MFFVHAIPYVLRQHVWWWYRSSSTVECISFMEIRSDPYKAPCYTRSRQGICIGLFDCSSAIISKSANALSPESIIEPPFCGRNIVQRLHHKVDLYQTPSTNETNRILEQLTNIIKQHLPNFSFNQNFGHDLKEYSARGNSLHLEFGSSIFLRSPSHLRKDMSKKRSEYSSYSPKLSSARSLRSNKDFKQSSSRLNSESNEGKCKTYRLFWQTYSKHPRSIIMESFGVTFR